MTDSVGITLPIALKRLGLDGRATLGDARKAYRLLSLKHHPDRVQEPELKAQADRQFNKIREAYEFLKEHPHLLRVRNAAGSQGPAEPEPPHPHALESAEARIQRLIARYRELHAVRPSPLAELLSRLLDDWVPLPVLWALYAAGVGFLLLRSLAGFATSL